MNLKKHISYPNLTYRELVFLYLRNQYELDEYEESFNKEGDYGYSLDETIRKEFTESTYYKHSKSISNKLMPIIKEIHKAHPKIIKDILKIFSDD